MKYLITISTLMAMSLSSWASWETKKVVEHVVTGSEACVAQTQTFLENGEKAVLEVYSEKTDKGNYISPTVLLYTSFGENILKADVSVEGRSGSGEYEMLQLTHNNRSVQKLIVKIDERKDMIKKLKKLARVNVSLKEENLDVSRVTFSLSGSTDAIDGMSSLCGVKFQ